MNSNSKLADCLDTIAEILEEEDILLRIWSNDILESAYIQKEDGGTLLVHDGYETFRDLDKFDQYMSVEEFSIEKIEEICKIFKASVIKVDFGDGDVDYLIGKHACTDSEVKAAVQDVLLCQDAIFHYGMHKELPDN